MTSAQQTVRRAERVAAGLCSKCGGKRDGSWMRCKRCRAMETEAKRRGRGGGVRDPKPWKPHPAVDSHCECGRGRKVVGAPGRGGIRACLQCLAQDGRTEAQFTVLQSIRASESPPSTYALAMECEASVDAIAHTVSRMVRNGVLGKRTLATHGGSKDIGQGETTEYYIAKGRG